MWDDFEKRVQQSQTAGWIKWRWCLDRCRFVSNRACVSSFPTWSTGREWEACLYFFYTLIYSANSPRIKPPRKLVLYMEHTVADPHSRAQCARSRTGNSYCVTHGHILSRGLISFCSKIKSALRITAEFGQIRTAVASGCDRLRGFSVDGGARERSAEKGPGISLSFCLPTRSPKLVKGSDSIC